MAGLDTEWCLSLTTKTDKHQKVAILQLCVGQRCLIFQLCHRDAMPRSLVNFLGNNKFTFVGKVVGTDAKKLFFEDCELNVAKVGDLSEMAWLQQSTRMNQ
ncbi:hypothetical protein Patl1_02206 [Pistacia atlantica]|uniref:Uncharacterized protein n=1 Tax=Pistacia atlantica TaxID=434234 RepID=A0ACC1C6L1_9ROSI|nr:hypothetical protein Patl1_02206 [Pistacia atlantica]